MICNQIKQSGTIAWSPSPSSKFLLATGTVEGVIDENFQSHSRLEFFDSKSAPQKVASVVAANTFSKLAWGAHASGSLPHGLLAGSMGDGSLRLWDPSQLLEGPKTSAEDAAICCVEGLGFVADSLAFGNGEKAHFIAAASLSDPKVAIIDVNSIGKTSIAHTLDSKLSKAVGALRWNLKVPHILAAGNTAGAISIWDLRQNKAVMNFKPQHKDPANAIAWNPLQALQIAVTHRNPVANIWDLRKPQTPKHQLNSGSSANFAGIDWNSHDPRLLLSVSEDSSCCLWRETGEALHQFCGDAATGGCATGVFWAPQKSSFFAVSSDSFTQFGHVPYAGDSLTPGWVATEAGARFSQFGQLVSFQREKSGKPSLLVRKSSCRDQVSEGARAFEKVLSGGQLRGFCESQSQKSDSDEDHTLWTFIGILFEANNKTRLLEQLGFKPGEKFIKTPEISTNKGDVPAKTAEDNERESEGASLLSDAVDEAAFFDQIGAQSESLDDSAVSEPKEACLNGHLAESESEEADERFEEVKKKLVAGDFERAVDDCLEAGNFADALVISSCDSELWEKTQKAYLSQHSQKFMKTIMSLVMAGQIAQMVETSSLRHWKQTLALVLTYADAEKCSELCCALAEKLGAAERQFESLICFICARNIEKMSEKLLERAAKQPGALYNAMEKVFLCAMATETKRSRGVQKLLAKYLRALFAQGQIELATAVLHHFHESASTINENDLVSLAPLLENKYSEKTIPPNRTTTSKAPANKNPTDRPKRISGLNLPPKAPGAKNKLLDMPNSRLPPRAETISANQNRFGKEKALPGSNQPAKIKNTPFSKPLPQRPKTAMNSSSQPNKPPSAPLLPPAHKEPLRPSGRPALSRKTETAFLPQKTPDPPHKNSLQKLKNLASLKPSSSAAAAPKSGNKQTLADHTSNDNRPPNAFQSVEGLSASQKATFETFLRILSVIESKQLMGMEKRKATETSAKLELLRQKMAQNELDAATLEKLTLISKDLSEKNFLAAKQRHVEIMSGNWSKNKDWLSGINTLLLLSKRHYN